MSSLTDGNPKVNLPAMRVLSHEMLFSVEKCGRSCYRDGSTVKVHVGVIAIDRRYWSAAND
jgi:hypothetical protein